MRVEVAYKSSSLDGRARRLLPGMREAWPEASSLRIVDVYLLDIGRELPPDVAAEVFADPVAQEVSVDGSLLAGDPDPDALIEVTSRPGVADPVAATARQAIEARLGAALPPESVVQTAVQYVLAAGGRGAEAGRLERIASSLHNPLIQQAVVLSGDDWRAGARFPPLYPHRVAGSMAEVETFAIDSFDDRALEELSRDRLLALGIEELRAIKAHFSSEEIRREREAAGLGRLTDVEIEMLAQTWSEHCKHKIFSATITYRENGRSETIRSLFATYIRRTTEELAARKPFLRSVFKDNAGVVEFDAGHLLCFKAETHNSPSALDPYGGAITGIVGVNRDILGTGKGAKPIFNTDVLCFGFPETPDAIEGHLHPARVLAGVHRGIVDGGNQSGIPVVAGAFVFDESFVGKPLVFCGTGGLLPSEVLGEPGWTKRVEAGNLAVMVGGRIGKDGIHGATFSSLALDEASPTSAVQIGDPIVQRRMSDFLLEARDLGLFKGINDNGAGGLSSSLGEMAQLSNGVRIELDRCPLKYAGLAPWEILVSESQERMSLAVAPDRIGELLALASRRDVEATQVGVFTDSGRIEVLHGGKLVGMIRLSFLHGGLPAMRLDAEWSGPRRVRLQAVPGAARPSGGLAGTLLALLADPSIASKEPLVRQFDHEVIGQSVVKPFVGERSDGPSDGAVLRPLPESVRGVTVTHGICPGYGAIDTYHMAMCAVDEAYRAHIALGGDPDWACALDNFCWPDPVESAQTPDGRFKLAQLVRACRGLREACLAYGLPLVSGKDSMKNDTVLAGRTVSIKPTLLVSLMGMIPDVRSAITSDFKRPGDRVYLLGETRGEMGATSFERTGGASGDDCPRVRPDEALAVYRAFHAARRLVASCHDLSEGGLAVALAESALAGRLGAEIDLEALARASAFDRGQPSAEERLLFCETPSRLLVTVPASDAEAFERFFAGLPAVPIGTVVEGARLSIRRGDARLIDLSIEEIEAAWKAPLGKG